MQSGLPVRAAEHKTCRTQVVCKLAFVAKESAFLAKPTSAWIPRMTPLEGKSRSTFS